MFNTILNKFVLPSFIDIINICKKLTQIYDYITTHDENGIYKNEIDVNGTISLFKSLSDSTKYIGSDEDPVEVDKLIKRYTSDYINDLSKRYRNSDGEDSWKIRQQIVDELKEDILPTYNYAVEQYIEDNMNEFAEYMEPDAFGHKDFHKAFICRENVLGLTDILFGFDMKNQTKQEEKKE